MPETGGPAVVAADQARRRRESGQVALVLRWLAPVAAVFAVVEIARFFLTRNPFLLAGGGVGALASAGFAWGYTRARGGDEVGAVRVLLYSAMVTVLPCAVLMPESYPFWTLVFLLIAWYAVLYRKGRWLALDLSLSLVGLGVALGYGMLGGHGQSLDPVLEGPPTLAACFAALGALLVSAMQMKQRLQLRLELLGEANATLDRRVAERTAELAQSAARYRTLAEAMPVSVFTAQ